MHLIIAFAIYSTIGAAWWWYPITAIAWLIHKENREEVVKVVGWTANRPKG